MSKKQEAAGGRSGHREPRRTIGLLIESVVGVGGYQSAVWRGVADTARERDVNLLCFAGGALRHSPDNPFEVRRNAVYDLVTKNNVDGLILNGTLGNFLSPEEFRGFYGQWSLPTVSIALPLEGLPSVLVDNEHGMRDAIVHLIEVHGYQRMAFIRGPEGNEEAEERYRVYHDTLAQYGISIEPDLVAPGEFNRMSGAAAIELLVDQRQIDFEALVAASDNMALGALEALNARGKRVPQDVAVIGFDDIEGASAVTPSLTTVRQPIYEQGKKATEMLLALLAGGAVPAQVTLPTELVVRQSCGCSAATVVQAAAGSVTRAGIMFPAVLAARREHILSEITQAIGDSSSESVPQWVGQLLDAFAAELKGNSPGAFLSALAGVLRQVIAEAGDVAAWQGAISVLRRIALPYLKEETASAYAEDLWQQARVVIAEMTRQAEMSRRLRAEQQVASLREIGEAMVTAVEIDDLMDVVENVLPRLGIPGCYVSLYESDLAAPACVTEATDQASSERPRAPTNSKLMLAVNAGKRLPRAEGKVFPSCKLVPEGVLNSKGRYSFVVEPLHFRKEQLGFALLEMGPRDGGVYEALRGRISSALKGALLVQQVEQGREYLRSLYRAGGSIISLRDSETILEDITTRTCEAVGACQANILLINKAGKFQRLAEGGPGERVGTMTLVESRGVSMKVMKDNEPFLIEDMGKPAPQTHFAGLKGSVGAAGCFPLRHRDKRIGVMWIFYLEPHQFSETEVSALQLYVNQAAVAYDNARRVDVLEHLRQAAQKLASVAGVHEVLQQIVESAREVLQADSVVVWSYDVGRKVFLPDELIADGVDTKVLDRYREDEPRPGGTADIVIRKGYLAVTDVGAQEYAYLNPPARGLRDEIEVKSFQGIALQVEAEPLGVLYVNYLVQQGFDEEDRSSLEAFAYHAALALKKARLMEQVQKAHDTAGIVAKVTVLEDLRHTLKAVVEGTCSVLGCDAVTLFVYNQAADRLEHPPTMVGVRHRARAESAGKVLRDSIVYDMLRRDDLYIVEKVDQDKLFQHRRFVIDEKIESVVAIPLQVAGQKVGVMFVNYRAQHRFSKAELDDIKLSADQAAVAIRNAQLYEAETSTAEALKAVYDAGEAVTSTLALDQILNRIAEQAHRITGRHGKPAQFSHIGLVEEDRIVFKARHPSDKMPDLEEDWDSIDLKRGKPIGITGRAVMTGVSQLVPDVREDDDYKEWDPGTRSELAVPIVLEGQSIGVIDVHHPEVDVFEHEDQQCLEFLAAEAAVAIKNARLFWEVERRAVQLTAASEVARDATAILNVEELLNHTVGLISARFGFYHAGIFLLDEECEYAVLKAASSEGGQRLLGRRHKLKIGEEGIVGYVAGNGEPFVALDVGENKRHFSNPDLPNTRSEIALPIRYHGQLIGVLDVQSTVSGAFTREDATVLQTMADHLGVAIQNAHLYQAVQQRARELGALNTVSQSIRCLTSIREVFHQVNQSIAQLADAQMCAILLFDEAEQALVCQLPIFGVPDEIGRRYRIPLVPGSPVYDIWQTQDYWIINGVGQSSLIQALGLEKLAEEAGLRDTLLVRLTTGNQDVGVIQASNRSDGRPFTEDDAQLLCILAGQAAAIIENARLYQELQTTKGRVGAMTAVAWMGTVVGAWRHAIGNYVTIIEDLTQLIRLDLDSKAPPSKIRERLREIDEVIQEIRMIPMPPLSTEEGVESVLINQLLEERIGQLQSRRGNYARVKYEMLLEASESASVRASPEWLRRVVDVLVDNAVRAMADSPNRRLRIATRCVDGSLEVAVSDTGSGIAEAVRSMLLQTPIEKPKGVKGAGLGLFLAQAILETYGGSIEVGPTGPKGTTMIIRLPLEP